MPAVGVARAVLTAGTILLVLLRETLVGHRLLLASSKLVWNAVRAGRFLERADRSQLNGPASRSVGLTYPR
jgi:hypothetical protein